MILLAIRLCRSASSFCVFFEEYRVEYKTCVGSPIWMLELQLSNSEMTQLCEFMNSHPISLFVFSIHGFVWRCSVSTSLYHDIVPFVSSSSIYVCCWGKNGNKNLHSQSFLKQDWRCLWSCISKRFFRIVVRISGFPQNSWHISTQPNKSCWYECV